MEAKHKRTRRTIKVDRAVAGASLDAIKATRNQAPAVRLAARAATIEKAKEQKKKLAAQKKSVSKMWFMKTVCSPTFAPRLVPMLLKQSSASNKPRALHPKQLPPRAKSFTCTRNKGTFVKVETTRISRKKKIQAQTTGDLRKKKCRFILFVTVDLLLGFSWPKSIFLELVLLDC